MNILSSQIGKNFSLLTNYSDERGNPLQAEKLPFNSQKFFFLFHQVNIDNLQFKKHHGEALIPYLKVQLCKLYNGKYMVASTQITSTEHFALIAVQVFKLSSHKVLFINRKDNRNC